MRTQCLGPASVLLCHRAFSPEHLSAPAAHPSLSQTLCTFLSPCLPSPSLCAYLAVQAMPGFHKLDANVTVRAHPWIANKPCCVKDFTFPLPNILGQLWHTLGPRSEVPLHPVCKGGCSGGQTGALSLSDGCLYVCSPGTAPPMIRARPCIRASQHPWSCCMRWHMCPHL